MKLVLLFLVMPIMVFGMDINNNNTISTDWAVALQKPTSSPQERLANLTIEQKIAQLFIPGMQLNDPTDFEKVTELIKKYPIGGVLLTHPNTPDIAVMYIQSLHETNAAQGHPLPLWITIDAECGLGQRLLDAISFSKAMTVSATNNEALAYEYGKEIGRQASALGAHINFAPVVDVNNNPENPVIGIRSFGEDPQKVTLMAAAYWKGVGDQVISCLKHFPDHGNTYIDSHLALPTINYSFEQLHEVGLKPYKALIKEGFPMIMVAHLLIPALDEKLPASISPKIIDDLLRKQLGFNGLVITDGLKMKAVADTYKSAELALLAFKAGNDIILQLDDTAAGIEALIAAYHRGEITQQQIDERVTRIWAAKNRQGLLEKEDLCPQDYDQTLFHTPYAYDLQQRLYEAAMTLVNNDNCMLPILNSMMKETLLIDIGGANSFAKELEQQGIVVKRLSRIFDGEEVVKDLCGNFNNIIISIAGMNKFAQQSYGISKDTRYLCNYMQGLSAKKNTVILFGMPYAASLVKHQGLLIAYEDNEAAQLAASKVVLGRHNPTGKLPVSIVSIGSKYLAGTEISF